MIKEPRIQFERKPQQSLSLQEVLLVIRQNRKAIIRNVLVVTILMLLYAVFSTPIFTAKARINPPQLIDTNASFTTVLSGLAVLPDAGSGASYNDDKNKTDSNMIVDVLSSENLKNLVIKDLNLKTYYRQTSLTLTQNLLKSRVTFWVSPKSGFIEIQAEDKNPQMAADLANRYVYDLSKYLSQIKYQKYEKQYDFINNQRTEVLNSLTEANANLNAFYLKNGIDAPRALPSAQDRIEYLQKQLANAQVSLQQIKTYATPNNKDYKTAALLVMALNQQIESLTSLKSTTQSTGEISLYNPPALNEQYSKLINAVEFQRNLYDFIMHQYEAARIDKMRALNPTIIEVIDYANVPEFKSKPKRALLILTAILISSLLSIAYFLLKYHYQVIVMAQNIPLIKYEMSKDRELNDD